MYFLGRCLLVHSVDRGSYMEIYAKADNLT